MTDELGNTETLAAGTRLSACDTDRNGVLTAEECCIEELGGGENCDPIYDQLAQISPRPIYDRDFSLPAEARCYCGPEQNDACAADVQKFCAPPYGEGPVPENTYIQRDILRVGGVIYDPAVKGVAYRPADLGNYRRALVERVADDITPTLIGDPGVIDGWRMADSGRGSETAERWVDYDSALCSGSEYRMKFETREGEQVLTDKVGNTLRFKDTYLFETPQFHVDITNRKPLNNLTIGPCTDFDLGFSNKYDLDPENLRKLQLWNIEYTPGEDPRCTDAGDISESNPTCFSFLERVAGGEGCTDDDIAAVDAGTAVPCLKTSVYFARKGELNFKIDDAIFGPRLFPESSGGSGWYRLVVPGLHRYAADGTPLQEDGWESLDDLWADNSISEAEKQNIYRSAFQDSCGMPLVTAGLRDADARPDFWYDIQIDNAACKDDDDFDGIESSCDNASSYFNPDQIDSDLDGFGDVEDKCAVTTTPQNSADADKDSIGDECDTCYRQPKIYNELDGAADVISATPYMRVRNVPLQQDTDQDGIGDACDNCPTVANCESFGPVADGLTPWTVNTPINSTDDDVCQVDKEDA
ncbi:MAG: thrombospondin, partial [Nannocystaceae bacterium]